MQLFHNLKLIFEYLYYSQKFKRKDLNDFLLNHDFVYHPNQSSISLPILRRIFIKMNLGLEFKPIKCEKNLLIDGHHRYLCSILTNKEIDIRPYRAPSTRISYEWKTMKIDEKDYDSSGHVRKCNLQDSRGHNADIKMFNFLFRRD